MLVTPAYAATTGAAPAGAGGFLVQILPLVLIFIVFYFLLIRPQQKRMQTHRAMIEAVKKNDVAVTSGGIVGKVVKVDEAEVELEIAQGVKVRVVKGMLSEVRPAGGKPAND